MSLCLSWLILCGMARAKAGNRRVINLSLPEGPIAGKYQGSKVLEGELSVDFSSFRIPSAGGLDFVKEVPDVMDFPFRLDTRNPFPVMVTPANAFKLACSGPTRFVEGVLASVAHSEIFFSVVEAIAVNVVNVPSLRWGHDCPVHKDIVGVPTVVNRSFSVSRIEIVPFVDGELFEVGFVNNSFVAPGERYCSHKYSIPHFRDRGVI